MSPIKRDRWTEAEVVALPTGEHDYFDRKSGQLLGSTDLRRDLAKALSAFANSGGGHLLVGISNDGTFDGVEPLRGRTPTREWLEQLIPPLLSYPLSDFRVHEVERTEPSSIPTGRVVIVIDVGDSSLAPHQSIEQHQYFYRAGGHSIPAPHFYLETLRNRLTSPQLTAKVEPVIVRAACIEAGRVFVALQLNFTVTNDGRLAAYKWTLAPMTLEGHPDGRGDDYNSNERTFPCGGRTSYAVGVDDTILPTRSKRHEFDLGVTLRPDPLDFIELVGEVTAMLARVTLKYRLISETSVSGDLMVALSDAIDPNLVAKQIADKLALE